MVVNAQVTVRPKDRPKACADKHVRNSTRLHNQAAQNPVVDGLEHTVSGTCGRSHSSCSHI